MNAKIKNYLDELAQQFDRIPQERKDILERISNYIRSKQDQDKPVNLVYICTHNSRRSHLGQIWAKVSADYFNIKNVNTFSGGTEATAFNINAISALQRVGFNVQKTTDSENPVYHVYHNDGHEPSVCFSKVYTDAPNPGSEFSAIMTCSDAEENCPFIPGVELRVGTTYDDPKEFDNTPLQDQKYDERCKQIALETFYAFSLIN
jgi:arsenate reductase (thioredoxin)